MSWLFVFLGGGLGSVARYGISLFAVRALGAAFPWGTLIINIGGSFIIGWFGFRPGSSLAARQFVMIGVCGGFTTFSSFSLQTVELLRAGHVWRGFANVALSVVLCLAAAALGIAAGRGGGLSGL